MMVLAAPELSEWLTHVLKCWQPIKSRIGSKLLESLSDTWQKCLISCLSKSSWHCDTVVRMFQLSVDTDLFCVEITPTSLPHVPTSLHLLCTF